MALNSKKEEDNDWAFDRTNEPIHISLAESGLKGYFCMGCNKEMVAIKMKKNPNHKSYFRHHVTDVDHIKEDCVYSSKEYREKLAYFYFMRVKEIKVPALYKYPPKGEDGIPMLLQEATTIVANRIEREVTFFEDEEGIIHSGKNIKIDDRYLWVRPDAVFYDKNDKPILFLEFVVTHKPDTDKLNKLQRLGINTVQIIVPKLAEPELEKEISKASKVKWTYNEIESNTVYISTTHRDGEGIPSIDEEQRKLFEESYTCRTAQIGNLIRAIKRCMGSQSYRGTEQLFEQEISRIEDATGHHQSRLDELQRGVEEDIYRELEPRRNEFDESEAEFKQYYSNLEERYIKKRWQLIEEQRDTDRNIEEYRQRSTGAGEDIRRKHENEDARIAESERIHKSEEGQIDNDIARYRAIEYNLKRERDELERFEDTKNSEYKEFERARKSLQSTIDGFEDIRAETESRIRGEFERARQQITQRINDRDIQSGDDLSGRIETILTLRGLFDGFKNDKANVYRFRKGIKFINDGTWKKWDK